MQWHEFIFSQKPWKRLLRHFMFWVTWWLYFSLCDYLYQHAGPTSSGGRSLYVTVGFYLFLKTLILVSIYSVASYTFIYFLLPQIIKGKWLKAATSTVFLGLFLFIAAYLMYWNVFPFVDSLFGPYKANSFPTLFWPAVYLGLINPTKVVATAAIIKYVKNWWLKQKESEKLEREKINAELQLLKAQIHPGFLFNALNNIYVYSLAASPRASGLLLKLSDLLSYMLYECEQPFVPLKKEIDMMKDYIALEKIRLDESFEMELNVIGDVNGKMIAPFLLLPFIENSFKQSSHMTGNSWINMDISMEEDSFHMKLANGMMPGTNGLKEIPSNGLANVQKRLTLIYPQKHELKISSEQEMLIVHLKIQLSDIDTLTTDKYEKPVVEELV
jgi:sensor histidine kinase YesM